MAKPFVILTPMDDEITIRAYPTQPNQWQIEYHQWCEAWFKAMAERLLNLYMDKHPGEAPLVVEYASFGIDFEAEVPRPIKGEPS